MSVSQNHNVEAYDHHIDHNIVIDKLTNLGVPTVIIRWVASFLKNRQQRVKIGNTFSLWLDLKGSIVQGSWLGPKLFITILINLVVELPTHKCMDDTTITENISCVEDSKMQSVANQKQNEAEC